MSTVLEAIDLSRHYALPRAGLFGRRDKLVALDAVSFSLEEGKTLGIVGESGSGKSTLARLLVGLEKPVAGEVRFMGQVISGLSDREIRPLRRHLQMIFQDPYGSLDPRMRILESVAEPLDHAEPTLDKDERRARVATMLDRVGLGAGVLMRYPHQFSGGQRQRIAIARALITHPKLIIADEPVSALDVSIQAQILNLLLDIRAEFGLSMVFISHDLGIIRYMSDRVVVMQGGRIVEEDETESLFASPCQPYTQRLLAAMPALET
jgi:ABC-type oligopeptide transport system ATPase subunit